MTAQGLASFKTELDELLSSSRDPGKTAEILWNILQRLADGESPASIVESYGKTWTE